MMAFGSLQRCIAVLAKRESGFEVLYAFVNLAVEPFIEIATAKTMAKQAELTTGVSRVQEAADSFHYARRGSTVDAEDVPSDAIQGYDDERMRARTLLTAEEEKKLMRRIDWRLMV